ncbi:VOC family protein [Deinococcus sp. Arct2-2]|uniref:VOC family protein n=1 Tax=Deinococcus sp. Arct2-2 TaxID=2568653 RepID=UPI0010A2BC2C|nr:VOC family protein [Deinococcus sp. Arct2-2]THF66814.1 VOC family protein [Deinococcus sp. Arct2-2]
MNPPLLTPATHIRLARPSLDLRAAQHFYTAGLNLSVLYHHDSMGEEASLLMLGVRGAAWHLELTHLAGHPLLPTPTEDDLLVLYLGRPVEPSVLQHLTESGGTRVPALNPYWDTYGVTIQDPDGYRLVLCHREWTI